MKLSEAWFGVLILALGVGLLALAGGMPHFPGQDYGPDFFPKILAFGFVGGGVLLLWRGIRSRTGGREGGILSFSGSSEVVAPLIAVIGACIFYIFVSEKAGFVISSVAILGALFMLWGVGWRRSLLFAPTVGVGLYLFFNVLMQVPLPRGWLSVLG
jgi:putative tricarboxylic transport membrane protein